MPTVIRFFPKHTHLERIDQHKLGDVHTPGTPDNNLMYAPIIENPVPEIYLTLNGLPAQLNLAPSGDFIYLILEGNLTLPDLTDPRNQHLRRRIEREQRPGFSPSEESIRDQLGSAGSRRPSSQKQILANSSLRPLLLENEYVDTVDQYLAPGTTYASAHAAFCYTFALPLNETNHPTRRSSLFAVATSKGQTAIAIPYDQLLGQTANVTRPDVLRMPGQVIFQHWTWQGSLRNPLIVINRLCNQFECIDIVDRNANSQFRNDSIEESKNKII